MGDDSAGGALESSLLPFKAYHEKRRKVPPGSGRGGGVDGRLKADDWVINVTEHSTSACDGVGWGVTGVIQRKRYMFDSSRSP